MASLILSSLRSPATGILRSSRVQSNSTRYIKSAFCPSHQLPRNSRTYAAVVVQNKPAGRNRRILSTVLLAVTSFTIGGYFALSYAPPFLTPLIMGSMPTNEETLLYEAPDEFTRQIDEHIKNHKVAQLLRSNPEYIESRHHEKIPAEVKSHHLTAGSLSGPDMLAVPPLFFNQKDGKQMICIFYVGQSLCGHPGIVHGGFLATMLDEGLAFCAFPALPNRMGVTAQLDISYKKPTMAGQYLALLATTTKVEGRKAWAQGGIVALDDIKLNEDGTFSNDNIPMLVSATALYVEPKNASMLKKLYGNIV